MPRLLPASLHLPASASIALGAFVAPWVLAVLGWSLAPLEQVSTFTFEEPPALREVVWTPPPPEGPADAPESDAPTEEVEGDVEGDDDVASVDAEVAARAGGGVPVEATAARGELVSGRGAGRAGGDEQRQVRRRSARSGRCKKDHPQIRTRDDGTVEIDRSLVRHYTRHLDEFLSLGVSGPYNEDGLRGWRIEGFGCTNPVYKAGFRKGDVLLTVNGKKTRTWPQVVFLYQTLKAKDRFDFEVSRRGQPVSLTFVVVDDRDA
jgi:membrane-associated protease RseP (regulator of RpoE activity)